MLETNFSPFPELLTARLLLRKVQRTDAAEVLILRSNPIVLKYIGKEPMQSLEEATAFIDRINTDIERGDGITWAIALQEKPQVLVGTIGFWRMDKPAYRAEIGYLIHPDLWGKGLIKEAIHTVLDYGFERMGLHSIEARISPENNASAAVLKANGFVKEGHLKESFCFRGKFEDTIIYSRLE